MVIGPIEHDHLVGCLLPGRELFAYHRKFLFSDGCVLRFIRPLYPGHLADET